MSAFINQVTILGNIGKITPAGKGDIANFSLATDYAYRKADGTEVRETEWHKVVAFGQSARFLIEHGAVGRQATVQGRLRTRKWTDASGVDRFTTEIIADSVQLVGPAPSAAEPGPRREHEARAPASLPAPTAPRAPLASAPRAARPAPAPAFSLARTFKPVQAPAEPAPEPLHDNLLQGEIPF